MAVTVTLSLRMSGSWEVTKDETKDITQEDVKQEVTQEVRQEVQEILGWVILAWAAGLSLLREASKVRDSATSTIL